jgi:hypothetical protein
MELLDCGFAIATFSAPIFLAGFVVHAMSLCFARNSSRLSSAAIESPVSTCSIPQSEYSGSEYSDGEHSDPHPVDYELSTEDEDGADYEGRYHNACAKRQGSRNVTSSVRIHASNRRQARQYGR